MIHQMAHHNYIILRYSFLEESRPGELRIIFGFKINFPLLSRFRNIFHFNLADDHFIKIKSIFSLSKHVKIHFVEKLITDDIQKLTINKISLLSKFGGLKVVNKDGLYLVGWQMKNRILNAKIMYDTYYKKLIMSFKICQFGNRTLPKKLENYLFLLHNVDIICRYGGGLSS